MQRTYAITGLVMLMGLAGCASGFPHAKQSDYDNLPGEHNMTNSPGLLSGKHYDVSENGGGTLLYSGSHPQKSVLGSLLHRNSGGGPGQTSGHSSSTSAQSGSSGGGASASGGNFSDFKRFQEYEQFKKLPASSPEKQRFKTFQQWQEYKRWEKQQQQQ